MSRARASKAKGSAFQRLVASKILEKFKSLDADDVKSAPMGLNGADVLLSKEAKKLVPWDIECKSYGTQSFRPYDIINQAEGHGVLHPVGIIKSNRKEPLAIVKLDHLLELQRKANGIRD